MIFVGDDWAEAHHDIYICDLNGERLAARRLPEGVEGVAGLHALVGVHAADPGSVVVGIETDRGLWVQAMVEAGYQVYAINPKAASRYRDRHTLSGAKSDQADAKMLAELVRTDRHNHRRVAGDTHLGAAVKILARAHQNLIWERTRHINRLRAGLLDYFPAAVATFDDLAHRDCLAVLDKAPSPAEAAKLTPARTRTLLRSAGRARNLDTRARQIVEGLRADALAAPDQVTVAYAATTRAQVRLITAVNTQIAELQAELAAHFEQHPDADIYLSQPGNGVILGARALAEFGDDPDRYDTAKSRKNYAGTSPVTVASGNRTTVRHRHIRPGRLAGNLDQQALCALGASPGARAFYDHRRRVGDSNHQALRALANRLVGILHGCLTHRAPYDEDTAWSHRNDQQTQTAA